MNIHQKTRNTKTQMPLLGNAVRNLVDKSIAGSRERLERERLERLERERAQESERC
jgi:hypothetical protein